MVPRNPTLEGNSGAIWTLTRDPQESRGCLTSKNALGSQQNSENFRTPAKRIQKGIYKAFIHMIMYIYIFFFFFHKYLHVYINLYRCVCIYMYIYIVVCIYSLHKCTLNIYIYMFGYWNGNLTTEPVRVYCSGLFCWEWFEKTGNLKSKK